jgi:hypothetical protein
MGGGIVMPPESAELLSRGCPRRGGQLTLAAKLGSHAAATIAGDANMDGIDDLQGHPNDTIRAFSGGKALL